MTEQQVADAAYLHNPCLNSRGPKKGGRPMPRHKLFLQKDDPADVGVRQYQYTAKQNRVDLLHFDVNKVPQLQSAVHKYDESLADGIAKSNAADAQRFSTHSSQQHARGANTRFFGVS